MQWEIPNGKVMGTNGGFSSKPCWITGGFSHPISLSNTSLHLGLQNEQGEFFQPEVLGVFLQYFFGGNDDILQYHQQKQRIYFQARPQIVVVMQNVVDRTLGLSHGLRTWDPTLLRRQYDWARSRTHRRDPQPEGCDHYSKGLPSGKLTQLLKMAIYSEFSH